MRKTTISRHGALMMSAAVAAFMATPTFAQEAPDGLFTMLGRIVFGVGSERVAIDVPQAVSVLNEDDIDREQASTVGDILEQLPGVSTVGSESPYGESFNIRGIGTGGAADESRIVMLIDGVGKYYEQYRLGSLFTEPEFFKRIEVLRGPSSSTLYGSGALGGVIAMETRDASDFLEDGDTFAVRQRLQFGDNGNGQLSSTILAFAPDDRFEALLGFNYRSSDNVESGAGTELFGSEGTSRSGIAKATYRFGNDLDQSFEFAYIRNESFVNDQIYNLVDATTTWGTVDRDFTDTTAYARYNFNPAGNSLLDLDVQLSYSETAVDMSDPQAIFLPLADYSYETTSLKIENRAEWSGENFDNYLTVGLSYADQTRRAEIDPSVGGGGISYHPAGETQTLGLYAQNELVFDDRFTIITGLRADRQTQSPSGLITGVTNDTTTTAHAANLALHYQINDNLSVFGSASYTERLPTIDEAYDTRATSGGASDPALDTLNPETSQNFEIGAAYTANSIFNSSDQLSFKGVVFRNNMEDQIARNNAGTAVGAITPTYINLDRTRIEGVELELAYNSERVFGSLAYTHLEGENIGNPAAANANLEDQIPADSVSMSLGYRFVEQNIELGWTGTYADSAVRYSQGAAINSPSYFVHDVYAAWQPDTGLFEGSKIRFGVSNLFDEDYRSHLQSTGTRRAGRTVTLTLSKTF
ncbi:TonB-dependent receptor domain-containing protein [Cochlodiniinecator piscidefendens]|uniref:TonB-dependent receptor domain-containing protein n=1 Tax=Cochlodiniinecator piscidefendens TaxID=2715756 RepID=UPI00140E3588|nr:TonB-dependent receptor [Cochlodiniinecator piscidefendens]